MDKYKKLYDDKCTKNQRLEKELRDTIKKLKEMERLYKELVDRFRELQK